MFVGYRLVSMAKQSPRNRRRYKRSNDSFLVSGPPVLLPREVDIPFQVIYHRRTTILAPDFIASNLAHLVQPLERDSGHPWLPGQEHDALVVPFPDKSSGAARRTR